MTKKELKEQLEELGTEPRGPDLSAHVLYLDQKLAIITKYLLEHKVLGGGR
jgi:hypothetical protein